MIPVIRKIGSYFRKRIGAEAELAGPHLCGVCETPTDPKNRHWSSDKKAFIDTECIPAYVRKCGRIAVSKWLDGEFRP